MADVRTGRGGQTPDRGQLLLVSGIGLAVLLVLLALVLNGVIYTENVAARDSDTRGTLDVIRYADEAASVTHTLLVAENDRPASEYEPMESNLTQRLADWSDRSTQLVARDGTVAWVDVTGAQHGTHIVQNASRNMTNATGATRWSVVEGTTAIPVFEMTIDQATSVTGPIPNGSVLADQGAFGVEIHDGGEWRTIYIYENSSGLVLQDADDDYLYGNCSVSSAPRSIDFVAGTVDGTTCDALSGLFPVDSPTDITFHAGTSATKGTYELIVGREAIDSDLHDGAGIDPYGERLLFNATLTIRYVTSSIDYTDTDIVVSGGDWP